MPENPSLDDLSHALLDAARAAGADAADAMALCTSSVSVDVRSGALEKAERSEGVDIGLRVFVGQRVATVSASDTTRSTMQMMAERAVAMAREAPEDPYAGLADPAQLATNLDMSALELADPTPEPSAEALKDRALTAEAAALEVEGISQVSDASAYAVANQMHLATSTGFSAGIARTNHGHHCVAIAGTGLGMERDHDSDGRNHLADLRGPAEIGTLAAQRALARLEARKPPTGAYPVLFDERVAASLIGHLLGAINGQAITRGSSWLLEAMGCDVLPKGVDLLEDPHRARVSGSRVFDGEGLPTAPRKIVEDGRLTSWLLDLASARKLGLPPTANAARGIGSGPGPTAWNIALTQGAASKEDLIRDMGTGLLVTSMIGSTINPNTGDYSRGAAGHWVENGQIAYPVNECTIAGNLRDMLRALVPANDARTHLSRVVPSLLVPGMTVAGD